VLANFGFGSRIEHKADGGRRPHVIREIPVQSSRDYTPNGHLKNNAFLEGGDV